MYVFSLFSDILFNCRLKHIETEKVSWNFEKSKLEEALKRTREEQSVLQSTLKDKEAELKQSISQYDTLKQEKDRQEMETQSMRLEIQEHVYNLLLIPGVKVKQSTSVTVNLYTIFTTCSWREGWPHCFTKRSMQTGTENGVCNNIIVLFKRKLFSLDPLCDVSARKQIKLISVSCLDGNRVLIYN